jgi:hypothetical protein
VPAVDQIEAPQEPVRRLSHRRRAGSTRSLAC